MNPIPTTTYWLQMNEAPTAKDIRQLPEDCTLVEMEEPSRPFYLYLYTSVGKLYQPDAAWALRFCNGALKKHGNAP